MTEMQKIERMFEQIDGNVRIMNGKLDAVVDELKMIKHENARLKEKVKTQEERILQLEREVRKKNIVINGVEDVENEDESEREDKVSTLINKIGVEINMREDIDEIIRVGKYSREKKRPILVKLNKERMRTKILQSTKNLKGTKIWINEDYPRDVRVERKMLVHQMKEARNKGCRAQIRYNKLIINDEVYTAGDIEGEELAKVDQTENETGNRQKRTVSERSPGGDSFEEQMRKITRISQKN